MSYNVSPGIFMVVELYLDKYYVRFNHYWLNFVYLYFYIFFIWIIVAADRLDYFPYTGTLASSQPRQHTNSPYLSLVLPHTSNIWFLPTFYGINDLSSYGLG